MDLIVSSMTINVDRNEVVDFTYPYWEDRLVVSLTPSFSTSPFYIFKPLSWPVWLLLLPVVLAIGIFLFLIYKSREQQSQLHLDTFMFNSFGILFAQGWYIFFITYDVQYLREYQ